MYTVTKGGILYVLQDNKYNMLDIDTITAINAEEEKITKEGAYDLTKPLARQKEINRRLYKSIVY